MSERIKLKFQKYRVITTLCWMGILFLGLISRGVISSLLFWLLAISIAILFISDLIYFIIRIAESHYLLITTQSIVMKQFLQPPAVMMIEDIESVIIHTEDNKIERIVLADGKNVIVIKHIYTMSKEDMLAMIKHSTKYPEELEITYKYS